MVVNTNDTRRRKPRAPQGPNEALAVLFDTLESAPAARAEAAVEALAIHRHRRDIVKRVQSIVATRRDARLDAAYARFIDRSD